MKKVIIIGLILIVGIVLLVGPYLKNDETPEEVKYAEFVLKPGNVAFKYGKDEKIEINVLVADIKKIEVFYGQKIIKTWNSPKKGKLSFNYNFSQHGIGIQGLLLQITNIDGETITEEQRQTVVFSDITPLKKKVEIVNRLPHNDTNYTQGLEFYKGELFEGTGDNDKKGNTMLGVINLADGSFLRRKGLGAPYFGEGITILNDKVYQLTWQRGKCFVWDLALENIVKEFSYAGEGWGLCNNGKELIMSDGSNVITFRDPETFKLIRKIQVLGDSNVYGYINELEYIDGKIYANVYTTNGILVIDPATGKVLETIDASVLEQEIRLQKTNIQNGEVLNGIAYNSNNGKLYLTGKNWPTLFEVKVVD